MPKYSVDEVFEIIRGLSPAEKAQLQARLPEALELTAASSGQQQSQSFENITLGSGNTFGINQVAAGGAVDLSKHSGEGTSQATQVRDAVQQLQALSQDIQATADLNRLQQRNLAAAAEVAAEELLAEPEPDRGLVEQSIAALSTGLAGVEALAEPVARVAKLVGTLIML